MNDPAHFGVTQTQVHTDPPSVVHQAACLTWTPSRPPIRQSGDRTPAGGGVKMVDFGNLGRWCELRAFPFEARFHDSTLAPQIEQRTRVSLAGSMGLSRTVLRTPARGWLKIEEPKPFACISRFSDLLLKFS